VQPFSKFFIRFMPVLGMGGLSTALPVAISVSNPQNPAILAWIDNPIVLL
jgi:hypothetical protein